MRKMLRWAVLAAALLAPALQATTLLDPAPRAIWTWEEESYAMLENPAEAERAIVFLQSKGINTIYLYADAFRGRNLVAQQPELYRRLIRRLRAAGMQAYALLGSAYLNTERYVLPRHHAEARAMFQRVLDYNAAAAPEERFAGANLDIEPHILDEWDTQKLKLLADFLDMSAMIMQQKRAAKAELLVGPAIPFWLDGIMLEWRGQRKPVSEHAQELYDYVALMDYRDRALGPDGIVSHAEDELRYASKIGRKVMLGVETTPNEIQKVSFDHLKEADMERELALAATTIRARPAEAPAFAGFVIHHYSGYKRWLEKK